MAVEFFRHLFRYATCHILNTGVKSVAETRERLLRIAATSCNILGGIVPTW